jgi:AmmeMemoRadiSam system protein B
VLRDTQGVAQNHAVLPGAFVPIVARFTGHNTCEAIAHEVSKELEEEVSVDLVVQLATELEEALLCDGAPFKKARAAIERAFADADVRPASHAGGAYHGEATKLAEYIDKDCFGAAKKKQKSNGHNGRLAALVAPHIDPWRGARCYGEAYGVLADAIPEDVDTFVLFGTSHAPMREPFSLCRKAFATPFGEVEADKQSIDLIASACDFDPYADLLNHKREHSLEFQVVFLKHLLGPRRARIIPILAGLGEQQSTGKSPKEAAAVEKFFDAVHRVVENRRAIVIAGADLAHVGPRFGDPHAYDESEREKLDAKDRESLARAVKVDAEAFWEHVSSDLDTRRVCGLAPIYALLRTLAGSRAHGRLGHYEQTVDPEEGSIVSHAALGFYL